MNSQKNIIFSVSINHHPISKQCSLKYLGVILDDKLNWKPQTEKLVTQLSKSSGMLFTCKALRQHFSAQICLLCSFLFLFNLFNTWGRANKTTQ